MKKYRASVLLFNDRGGKYLYTEYFDGLKAARAFVPVKLSYCRNAGGFVGYKDDPRGRMEYWVFEC